MAKRDYSDTGQLSQSDELFEDIFRLSLTKEQRKKKAARPAEQTDKKSRTVRDKSPAQPTKVSPPPPIARGAGKRQVRKTEKSKVVQKRPRSGRRRKLLLVLLLFAAAGAAGTFLPSHLKLADLFRRAPVKSTIKREMPPKPSKKSASLPLTQGTGNMVEKGHSGVIVKGPSEPSAPAKEDPLPPGEGRAAAPRATQTARESKTPATLAPPPSPVKARSFPYSIYLGSFKKEGALQNALSIFRERGLSPYVVRMDLGEKGVWLRVFSGHFSSQEEAEAWIKKNQIADAETKNTRYAVLLGEFSLKQEAEKQAKALEASGCHPYLVGVSQTGLRIYSGAYYRMEDAEKELARLASKGVKGKIVER